MADTLRLLTRGHYVYALGYYDGRNGNVYDSHFEDKSLRELYSLGHNAGVEDFNKMDKGAV